MEREYRRTPDWPEIQTPLTGEELAEIWQDGEQRQGPLSVLGGVPSAHATSHKFGGADVVGTQDKTANAIPITDGLGTLDVFVSDASTTVKGKTQLATNGESAANKAVQSNDARLSNSRTPTAHAASHLGGSDDLGLGTAAFLNSGLANGVCPLNASSQVDSGYLPSYVDDVIEVANYAALPATGESGKIYVTLDTNLTYRWSGSAYVEISKSLALGETSATAYQGDRGKTAYDHSQATGNPHGTAIADIATLNGKITPLSDLSRVFQLNGNVIPATFPDNVAGMTYWQDAWATTDGWKSGTGAPTLSVSNGKLLISNTANIYTEVYKTGISAAGKSLRFAGAINANVTVIVQAMVSGVFTNIKSVDVFSGVKFYFDALFPTGTTTIYIGYGAAPVGAVLSIDTLYIGSGLFDTPVYGADGQSVWENHGVLAVPGKRGNAMLFQGGQYVVSTEPLMGKTGTFPFMFKRNAVGPSSERLIGNIDYANHTGLSFLITSDNFLTIVYGTGSAETAVGTTFLVNDTLWHDCEPVVTDTQILLYVDGVLIQTISKSAIAISSVPVYIGRASHYDGEYFNGVIESPGYYSNAWSADDALRYHNGDDTVDSQQKAQSPVPYSIMTRKSDGRTEVSNGVDQLDAINKGQLDAACTDFLMQSYTAGSTFSAGQLGHLHTDGKVYLYDANVEASAKGALYIAIGAITANNVGTFQRGGEFITTGLSVGAIYYGSETPGAITTTAPTTSGAIVRKIGYAQSSTVLFFNPSNDYTTVTSVSGMSQTITLFSPSVKFAGNEVGVTYYIRKGYMVTTGKQIEYHVEIQLTNKGSSVGPISIACPTPPAVVFSIASASVWVDNFSYSGHLQATLVGGSFGLSQLSEAGDSSDLTNTNVANNSIIRLHGVLVAQ